MQEALQNIIFVLYQPQELANVGAILRAMRNYGLTQLRLVEPAAWDPYRLTALAHESHTLIEGARHYDTLEAALADCGWVVGTTRRPREPVRERYTPRSAAPRLLAEAGRQQGPVAILFGRETDGLPREALDQCHSLITIPTDTALPSLNLGQAALVLAYELWLAAADPSAEAVALGANGGEADEPLATGEEREALVGAFAQVVEAMLPRAAGAQLERAVSRTRAVLLRSLPRRSEAEMLTRFFTQVAGRIRHR